MIDAQPQILMSSLDDKIKPCADFLICRLRLTPAEASKVVQGNPSILGFSVPDNLEVKVAFYCEALDIDAEQVAAPDAHVSGSCGPHTFSR